MGTWGMSQQEREKLQCNSTFLNNSERGCLVPEFSQPLLTYNWQCQFGTLRCLEIHIPGRTGDRLRRDESSYLGSGVGDRMRSNKSTEGHREKSTAKTAAHETLSRLPPFLSSSTLAPSISPPHPKRLPLPPLFSPYSSPTVWLTVASTAPGATTDGSRQANG